MQVLLKKFDLLIRDNSSATQAQIQRYLNNVFNSIEKDNNNEKKVFGYASVFDARTSEYYLYYSDAAKSFFRMTRNKYNLIPDNIVTTSNFMNVIKENLTELKRLILGNIRIVVDKIKINKNKTAELTNKPMGDIVFSTAEIDNGDYYEDFIVTLQDGKTLVGFNEEDVGKEVIVSYMTNDF